MIVSGTTLRERKPISPFFERTRERGVTYGLGPAGYDVRLDQYLEVPAKSFALGSTVEEFNMPLDMIAFVHDKSTWARLGLSLFNTVIEPGWKGYLTLELFNSSDKSVYLEKGIPIAQIIFQFLDKAAEPYNGKYQNQRRGVQEAIFEER